MLIESFTENAHSTGCPKNIKDGQDVHPTKPTKSSRIYATPNLQVLPTRLATTVANSAGSMGLGKCS